MKPYGGGALNANLESLTFYPGSDGEPRWASKQRHARDLYLQTLLGRLMGPKG